MSRKSKLPNLKEETTEDISKYDSKKSKKGSRSKIVPAVQQQSAALTSDGPVGNGSNLIPRSVMRQSASLDAGGPVGHGSNIVPQSVKRQSARLDAGDPVGYDSNIVPQSVMQQSANLDAGGPMGHGSNIIPLSVMQQSANLDAYDIVEAVQTQSMALSSKIEKKRKGQGPPPPPPPAPPPDLEAFLAHPPLNPAAQQKRIKIEPRDLELERKKLKKPHEIKKQANLERDDFFDLYQNYRYIPLVDARESIRLSTLRTEVISISFDGIEQLTDAFLFSLYHCKLSLDTVKWISLTGCYNITDEGVYWISLAFTKLKSIQLSGCSKVTEKSLYYLSKLSMEKIILDGTNCGVLPVSMNNKPTLDHSAGAPTISTNGCPLISPLTSQMNRESGYKSWSPGNFQATHRKMVILTPEDLPWSPLAVLTNGQDLTAKPGLTFKQDWTPFKDYRMTDVKSSAEIFNVFQIPRQKGLSELILSPGSIVILPYYLHKDMPPNPAADLAYAIVSVLSKYDDCTFVIWGMSSSEDNGDYEKTVQKMHENVRKYLSKWFDRLEGSIRTGIHTNWRMAACNYLDQVCLSSGQKLIRVLKSLLSETEVTNHLISSSVKVDEKAQLTSSDLKFLSLIVEADENLFPWNRQAMMSNKVQEYSSKLKKTAFKLTTVSNVQNVCKFQGLPERTYNANISKLIKYAALWGQCLYYPELEIGPVVTDFQFLADVIQKVMFTSAPWSCDIRCLGENIPCWKQENLMKVWPGATEEQSMLLIRTLEKLGYLLTFPIDLWSSIQDVSFVYVFYKDFSVKQPPMLEEFWPIKKGAHVVERTKFYFCDPGLPESFFPNLLRHVFKLGGPVVAWKDGAVIQKGHLTVLVEKIYECQGLPVIVIQVRGHAAQEMKHTEDWTTLKLYSNVMDHLALKYSLTFAKTIPCLTCPNSTVDSRYEILASKKPGRYFHEHLIRAGEHRDVKCKHCHEASSAPLQIGPAINLSDLVPAHDRAGCAQSTSNFLNRCLMCENCAVDGIHCHINLKQGLKNWRCGCEQEGMLCNYCGMCQRCFVFIKRAVSVVEPVFMPPQAGRYSHDQLVALDEVNVTEKGSIVGLLSSSSEINLKSNALTPNYCPDLTVTVIKNGHFVLTLSMMSANCSAIKYESNSGKVSEEEANQTEKELLGSDAFRRCNDGDTLKISLRYLMGSFMMMRVILLLNDTEIYSKEMKAMRVTVKLNSSCSDGVFLQIKTPGKFLKEQKEQKTEKKAVKSCGDAVLGLPCALEMKMYNMLEAIEQVCFGGRGLSMTGSACLTLPSKITLDSLKYPKYSSFDDVNYHHLCLTWNPVAGKAAIGLRSKGDTSLADRTSYSSWMLKRLIHLVDAEGINQTSVDTTNELASLFWMWHFIISAYPEMILPGTTSKLLGDGFLTENNLLQVKEGLRLLIRTGLWRHFNHFDIDSLEKMFKTNYQGKLFLTAKNDLVQGGLALQDMLQDNLEKTGLKQTYSRFNKSLALYLCPAHSDCMRIKESLPDVLPELSGHYAEFLTFIDMSFNDICVIPDNFFNRLPNLLDLKIAHNFISEIPASIKNCKKLMSLVAMENNLSTLPEELAHLKNFETLEIGSNCFSEFPRVVTKMTGLTRLLAPFMMFTEMPDDIGNLVNLKSMHVHGNCFTRLPKSFSKLVNLEELSLNGVQWTKLSSSQDHISYSEFHTFRQKRVERWLIANGKDKNEWFNMFDENSNGVLDIKEVGKLNAVIFNMFPRLGYKGKEQPDDSTPHGFPVEILSCKKLKVLLLRNQGFTKIPSEICQLENLYELSLGQNPNLLSIPAELGRIKSLKKLDLDDCPLLKTPPREIRDKGFNSTFAYLQRLMSGAVLSKRTKLMLVGLGGAGKTSLVKSFLSETGKAELEQGEAITDGIDIQTWQVNHEEEKITYNIWDFAGQTVYYNTHQFFLSANRAVYLLLWNVRLGHEHAGLDFWLSSISVQAPKAPVFVIGTHIDQVNKSELPIEEMQQRYPQVVGFHFISSYTGQGISSLKTNLFEVTLQQQYMGEHIPAVWLTFEKNIETIKERNDIVTYKEIEMLANKSGIFEPSEIFQAVQFLHDLGSVQHFSNEYLKSNVVINPQWIVDVMACVVSVKNDFIKNGRLQHDDLDKVWSAYPKKLRGWLLRLTEEFDLTFPLKDQPVNLVPCLLPEKKPHFVWPEIERGSDLRENKMVYIFDYLPAGLFNRAQVRLHSLSDSALIWKKGSFLTKNVHVALLQHVKDSEMVVTAQGPRPENILFLIHEVFEGLIAESFHGVTYDFTIPCPECQRMVVKDPHLFSASTIRRALDMQAPFLQCIKYFHTISCATLQTVLPPDSHSDFDAQLVHCVQGLKHLHKDLTADIFISYCVRDDQLDKSSFILPCRVHSDLVNKGYKCWFKGQENSQSTDEMAKALIDSSVFLAFVSANYADDIDCVNIFKYARLVLKKTIVVVAIGDGFEWKHSKLGILLSDEVFVNMTKPKLKFYDIKFEEMLKTLKDKSQVGGETQAHPKPQVFFSYTWVNSAQAVALGTREVPGALGYGDPRLLKTFLEEEGIRCWIDVERVGMNGLFDDIAEGLLSAKVVIVCVSDEYATSSTCQIEFRYAANTLKLPIIMAVMGSGDNWRATEVGLTSVQYPIVNFQEKTKNAKKKLLHLVRERLVNMDSAETAKAQKDKSNEEHKNLSYQELFELGQRRLLRQLTMYAENQDLDVYPRVFVVDFAKEPEEEDMQTTDEDKLEEEKADVEKEKLLLTREKSNAKQMLTKKSSVMYPAYRLQKYCVYTLCEHDEGWHSVAEPLELEADFGIGSLDMYSPYISRLTTVMKYNKKLVLNCLTDDVGEAYIDWLEKSPEATMSDYQNVYHSFREMVFRLDTAGKMGNLSRCHLSNGKTVWLCDKHRDSMRVTCLSKDDKSVNLTKDADTKVTNWMLLGLRSVDQEMFEFKSNGIAPRPKSEMNKYGVAKKKKDFDTKKGKETRKHHKRHEKGKQELALKIDTVDGSEQETKKQEETNQQEVETKQQEVENTSVVMEKSDTTFGQEKSKQNIIHKDVSTVPHKTDRQQSEDIASVSSYKTDTDRHKLDETASVTSEASQSSARNSATDKGKQRRPLPGQSQYKPPTYKQKSRACEIS